jgi:hypothetical protein
MEMSGELKRKSCEKTALCNAFWRVHSAIVRALHKFFTSCEENIAGASI